MASYYDTIIADGPVNYWRLGESSGNALDEMAVHDLVWSGTPTYGVAGLLHGDTNTAMTLDGTTEYASKAVANYRSGDSQGSIEFLLKIPSFQAVGPTLLSSCDTAGTACYFAVYISASGLLGVAQRNNNDTADAVVGSNAISLNQTHHCVITSNGTAYKVYIDGAEQSLTVVAGSNTGDWFADTTLRDSIDIGAFHRSTVVNYFAGTIDEVAIYDYELSAAQVTTHYTTATGALERITSAVVQPYKLEGSPLALLSQDYNILKALLALVEQPYGLRLLTALIQYYGDIPVLRRLLAQYYGSATVLRRICSQPYDDYLKLIAAVDQDWVLPEALRRVLSQEYAVAGERINRLLDEGYNLNDYSILLSLLDQIYVALPSESEVQSPVMPVKAGGVPIYVSHISIEVDEGSTFIRGEIHVPDEADFIQCHHMQTVSITVDATEYVLLVENPRKSRPELGREEYVVPLISPTVLLDNPYADRITVEFNGSMASAIVVELAGITGIAVDWQIVDWYIPSATLYANNESPLSIITRIVEAVGGILQTSPGGVLICRPEYPISLPDWQSATPDFYLTDMDNFFSVDSTPVIRDGYNRFLISNQDTAAGNGLTLEEVEISSVQKQIRVYQVPWNDDSTIKLQTSGGEWVSIIADGVQSEVVKELSVEITAGEGSISKPFYGFDSPPDYLQTDLGDVTITEGGQIKTEVKDNSLLNISYLTKFHQFTVVDARIEDVQFFPYEELI